MAQLEWRPAEALLTSVYASGVRHLDEQPAAGTEAFPDSLKLSEGVRDVLDHVPARGGVEAGRWQVDVLDEPDADVDTETLGGLSSCDLGRLHAEHVEPTCASCGQEVAGSGTDLE